MDARLASSWYQQGKLQLQVNQRCSMELACWEQLEVRWARKLETIKNHCKNQCFLKARGAPRWAQEGSRNYLGSSGRCPSSLFRHVLGSSWALLGPPWPFSWGPGGFVEADAGLERLDLGAQGGQKLRSQKLQKTIENQGFW